MPQHNVYTEARKHLNVGVKFGVPKNLRDALMDAHPHLYKDHKALLCLVVMSWIIRAAIITGTAVDALLIVKYTKTVTKMCLAYLASMTAEQLKGTNACFGTLAADGAKLAGHVKAVFGENLPHELPLPRENESSPWLSSAMWHAVM